MEQYLEFIKADTMEPSNQQTIITRIKIMEKNIGKRVQKRI